MIGYARPTSLEESLHLLASGPHRVLAGGTDVYPADAAAAGWGRRIEGSEAPILDISAVAGLDAIREHPDEVEIGALVTWTAAVRSNLPGWFDGVREAAVQVGGRQIQNRGTIAGNLCNASPAADGVPPLLALDARVRLASRHRTREVALEQFVLGNRRIALAADEMLTAVIIPRPAPDLRATFSKLGARRFLVISIAMVSVCATIRDGRIGQPRIAVGACSEVARRLRALEARLDGASATDAARIVGDDGMGELDPVDDLRGSAGYRRHGARMLVRRAMETLIAGREDARRGAAGRGDARQRDAGQGDAGPGDTGPGDTGPGDAEPGDAGRKDT